MSKKTSNLKDLCVICIRTFAISIFIKQIFVCMLYISYEDQERIKRKIKRLPSLMRGQILTIYAFQIMGTLILTQGACISVYKHPISQRILDPACDLFIACYYYFALSVSVPFTGGHLNPATTMAFHLVKKNKNMIHYFIAQIIGASIAALIADWFFDVVPAPYLTQEPIWSCLLDTIGQIWGLFVVLMLAFYVTQSKYASGQYYGYLIISISVFMGRAFTFRKGCINPAIGLVFQLLMAFKTQNAMLILYSLPVIIGPTIGAILAYYVFKYFYKPLIQELKQAKQMEKEDQF